MTKFSVTVITIDAVFVVIIIIIFIDTDFHFEEVFIDIDTVISYKRDKIFRESSDSAQ